jgi:GAF domain-containing protein
MNTDRLLRDIEKRLEHLAPSDRAEAVDAIREEIARERRHGSPPATVEVERERRLEAETLRAILEAINRQGTLEETIEEVLRQLSKIVAFDSCSVALVDADDHFRVIAARGFPLTAQVIGVTFRNALTEILRRSTSPLAVGDVLEDDRYQQGIAGTPPVRSWAGIPLLVEGEVIGILNLDRHHVDPFEDEDLHRAKAVAFSAAAAIRKAQLLEKVRRYAALMERLVQVDQAVFAGRSSDHVLHLILDGALRVGTYRGGLLLLEAEGGPPRVAAASGDIGLRPGAPAPALLASRTTLRLTSGEVGRLAADSGITLPACGMFLVPVATADVHVGTLALLDPNGISMDDRLMEAYATRAAVAYFHSTRKTPPPA